jgi:hypothetical protein
MPILQREGLGDIPTPPRAMTKLFDATYGAIVAGPPGENRRSCTRHNTRFGRNPNRIVNLTLTTQTSGKTRAKPPAAWTLQVLSCTTNKGAQVA